MKRCTIQPHRSEGQVQECEDRHWSHCLTPSMHLLVFGSWAVVSVQQRARPVRPNNTLGRRKNMVEEEFVRLQLEVITHWQMHVGAAPNRCQWISRTTAAHTRSRVSSTCMATRPRRAPRCKRPERRGMEQTRHERATDFEPHCRFSSAKHRVYHRTAFKQRKARRSAGMTLRDA